ncbi:MAG: DUF5074 domain-containing protein [Dysgonomonas sp.]|jgi:hypothetical protein|uniref:DUF5074 domain-containing protein n=1 Tax=Dysgonomonas sp. TaxID=1891233 RepID=UPI00281D5A70|nr:hypothetical protein [Prevotella sp.]
MKHLFRKIGWLFTLSVILFTGCQQDEEFSLPGENGVNTGNLKSAVAGYDYLANTNGVFVLSEGNMTTENGTLSYIDASGSSSTYPSQNWVYGSPASGAMGNVSQDLFIANNKMYIVSQNGDSFKPGETTHILRLNNELTKIDSFNPGNYFPTSWSGSGSTPTHLAVNGNSIYIRTNSGVVIANETTTSTTPTSISGITKPSRIRMAMVKNSGVKYLYVGSEQGTVYRINTSTNAVSSISVSGKVAGLVAVRRNSNADQYIYALSIVSNSQAILYKISGTTIDASYTINSSFNSGLLIPSVGLSCYAGGTQDVIYFRSNGWNPTQIFKYAITSTTAGTLSTLYTVPGGIDPNAQIIYGDLAVDQRTGDVYFGYVGNWGVYATVNGVGRLRGGNPSSIQEYKASATGTSQIDTRFTAGIYFTREFDM